MTDKLISILKSIKSEQNKVAKMHGKNLDSMSQNQLRKHSANLNWSLMHIQKLKIDFCREFENSSINIGAEEREFNPSGFHSFKH